MDAEFEIGRAMNKLPQPKLSLRYPPPAARQMLILDTNIMNYALTSVGGAVMKRINADIAEAQLINAPTHGVCMTPFQILEVLGIQVPEIDDLPKYSRGDNILSVVTNLVDEASAAYSALPALSQSALQTRANERRSYLPQENLALFDICINGPLELSNVTEQIASALAWDHALKATYPKLIANAVDTQLAILSFVPGWSHVSRFRVAKRLWDKFYMRGRARVPEAADQIAAVNRAMRLKTRRDFLDCDLFHLACFGWDDDDVVALTCDPPETILARISVYKGMVEAVAASGDDLDPASLPVVRQGLIVRCEPDGSITHIFPVQDVPTIG